jgi:hypothetical protein
VEKMHQKFHGHEFNLEKEFSSTEYDILPEEAMLVFKQHLMMPSLRMLEILQTQTQINKNLYRSGYNDCNHEFDDPLGVDIENFLFDTPEDIDKDAEPETFLKWLDLKEKSFQIICCGYIE